MNHTKVNTVLLWLCDVILNRVFSLCVFLLVFVDCMVL